MPAEWTRHVGTWLAWPRNETTWPGKLLSQARASYAQMITALLSGETVNVLIDGPAGRRQVATALPNRVKLSNLIFHEVPFVDSWIRDYGPLFVLRGSGRGRHGDQAREKAFVKWRFNAWGGKYTDLATDDAVVGRLSALRAHRRFDSSLVMEGGSLELDGRGTCLTTEQCLLNPNRNPSLSRRGIERALRDFLGAEKVIWLKEGIEGDDTDGHVDDITRFVGERTVITALEPDSSDANHGPLEENLEILRRETDVVGRKLRILELPMPGRVACSVGKDRYRLPASYANFYIGNAAVLLPVYSHANDRAAARVLKRAFPTRKIVPIESTALVHGLGSIHCVTQQEPSV